jgi:P-type E1-E2 ATPase
MITIEIPGRKTIEASYLVLDFNGTLAIDGKLIDGTKPLLELFSNQLTVHVLTADTFGTAARELSGINCTLKILSSERQDMQKESHVFNLGEDHVIAIGNGLNDALMLKCAALGIVVLQKEGASVKTLLNADLVCNNIIDALELLTKPKRISASLRN